MNIIRLSIIVSVFIAMALVIPQVVQVVTEPVVVDEVDTVEEVSIAAYPEPPPEPTAEPYPQPMPVCEEYWFNGNFMGIICVQP